jgi:hypothetical protein
MKYFVYVLVAICCPFTVFCQDITGLWKGTLINDSTQQTYNYEILISKTEGKLTCFSQTYYRLNDEIYYSIKKMSVRIAHDGKIILQDAKLIESNLPINKNKQVIQLNVLAVSNIDSKLELTGLFVTNRSKYYDALTGRINVNKVNPLISQSNLLKYLEKNMEEDIFTAVK